MECGLSCKGCSEKLDSVVLLDTLSDRMCIDSDRILEEVKKLPDTDISVCPGFPTPNSKYREFTCFAREQNAFAFAS